MLFMEALAELKKGNYVTRNGWEDGSFLALLPSMLYVWKVAIIPNPAAGNWLPLVADLDADDWRLLSKECGVAPANDAVVEAAVAA